MSQKVPVLLKTLFVASVCVAMANVIFHTVAEPFIPTAPASGRDFLSYYFAANIVRTGEVKKLYNLDVQQNYQNAFTGKNSSRVLPFRGLPALALIYVPFSNFEPITAFGLFLVFSLLLLVLTIYILSKCTGANFGLVAVLCFTSTFFVFALYQGQPSFVFLFCLVLSYYFLKSGKHLIGGLVLSLLFLKIQYFPVAIIFALLTNSKKYFWGFCTGTVTLFLGNVLMYGIALPADYIKFVLSTETSYYGSMVSCTLFGLVELLNIPTHISGFSWFPLLNAAVFLLLLVLIFIRRNKLQASLEDKLSFAIVTGFFLSIHVLHHDLLPFVIPLVFSLMHLLKGLESSTHFFLTLLAYFLIAYLGVLNLQLNLIAILLIAYAIFHYGRKIGLFKHYI